VWLEDPDPARLAEDAVLQAARRIKVAMGGTHGQGEGPRPAESEGRNGVAEELGRLEHRLETLLTLLQAVPADAATPASCADPLAAELMGRARGYFDEWRQLLLEERSPAGIFEDFACSSYVDLLERVYARLFLLLDGEGRLLRICHAERGPRLVPPPQPGDHLNPSPVGPERVSLAGDWSGLPELALVRLGDGQLLALCE
jgi:hypothetical protein